VIAVLQDDAAPPQTEPGSIDRAGLRGRTLDELRGVWVAYAVGLPEGHEQWRLGAAYVRESNARSMTREAPAVQLSYTLNQFARRQIWVAWEAVFFDNASGTSIAAREAFQRLLSEALEGRYTIIGAYLSDRLFRNAKEAQEVKREFLMRGIELDYLGKLEGDARSPLLWQSERTQELMDEYWARKTSEQVGRAIEHLTANGRPTGRLPEGYRVGERGPSYMGEPGRILSYERNEPLASIIVAGKERYLEGASYVALAAWSATTDLHGLTPAGARMDWHWWAGTLRNPKYAGYQMPSHYTGFKPGTESPKRPRPKIGDPGLVPCMLPALYPLADWDRLVKLSASRQTSAKVRRTYRVSLLSSIAYDDRCGHRIAIHAWLKNGLQMMCGKPEAAGRHSGPIRVEGAERDLDALIGDLHLADPVFLSMVEQELERFTSDERPPTRILPDPEIARIEAALSALGPDAGSEMRGPLVARLRQLRARHEERGAERSTAIRRYRASIDDLRNWSDVWAHADVRRKNELLKLAGVTVRIGRRPGAENRPASLLSIEAKDPIFALALASATTEMTYHGSTPDEPWNVTPLVVLDGELKDVLERALEAREQHRRAA
jgi:Resolvase, N terminal domain